MAASSAGQERIAAIFMSVASLVVGVGKFIDRPAPGEIVEMPPDWYVNFNLILHGFILLALGVSLGRLGRMTEDKPQLRGPFLVMILVGIAAAAYVLGRDLGWV